MVQFLWDMVYNWKVIVTIETENHFQNYSFSDSDEDFIHVKSNQCLTALVLIGFMDHTTLQINCCCSLRFAKELILMMSIVFCRISCSSWSRDLVSWRRRNMDCSLSWKRCCIRRMKFGKERQRDRWRNKSMYTMVTVHFVSAFLLT